MALILKLIDRHALLFLFALVAIMVALDVLLLQQTAGTSTKAAHGQTQSCARISICRDDHTK